MAWRSSHFFFYFFFFANPSLRKVSLPPSHSLPAAPEMPCAWSERCRCPECRGGRGSVSGTGGSRIVRTDAPCSGPALLLSHGVHDGRPREPEPHPSRSWRKRFWPRGRGGAVPPRAPNGLMSVRDGCERRRKPGSGAGRGLGPASLPAGVGRTGAASAESGAPASHGWGVPTLGGRGLASCWKVWGARRGSSSQSSHHRCRLLLHLTKFLCPWGVLGGLPRFFPELLPLAAPLERTLLCCRAARCGLVALPAVHPGALPPKKVDWGGCSPCPAGGTPWAPCPALCWGHRSFRGRSDIPEGS